MLSVDSSGSLATASSLMGIRDTGAGEELWTTMEGVEEASTFFAWVRRELRRDRERASGFGGGDFKRGEMGQ